MAPWFEFGDVRIHFFFFLIKLELCVYSNLNSPEFVNF